MASWSRGSGPQASDERVAEAVRSAAWRLRGESSDYAPLLTAIGDSRVALLGAATEGTHEFNRERMALTQRLIVQKGFRIIAIDAGWSDAYRVNRFIHGVGFDRDAEGSLADFKRFPSWCWGNADALDFVSWLRQYNDAVRPERRVSFFGLDLYNLRAAMVMASHWLALRDSEAAQKARRLFSGFDQFNEDRRPFIRQSALGISRLQRRELCGELLNLHRRGLVRHAFLNHDDAFLIEESGRLVAGAEDYYGSFLRGGAEAWNAYERHLASTVQALLDRLDGIGDFVKVAIWASNSHVGDAAAVSTTRRRTSLGHMLREGLGDAVFSIGSFTYEGTLTAAGDWDEPSRNVRLAAAADGSVEALFHLAQAGDFLLLLNEELIDRLLSRQRLERAVGVVYRQDAELSAHYFRAELPRQFDAVLHFDRTRAVEPIEAATALRA